MIWLVQAESSAALNCAVMVAKAIGLQDSSENNVGGKLYEEKSISFVRDKDMAANSSVSTGSSTCSGSVSTSGTLSTLDRCACALPGRFTRYSSLRPSIPPPGWKQVASVWPVPPQLVHLRILPIVLDWVNVGSVEVGVGVGLVTEAVALADVDVEGWMGRELCKRLSLCK